MKKLFVLLFFMTAVFAFGQSIPEGLEWEIVDGRSIVITSYEGNVAPLQIPERIQGLPVTAIGNYAFSNCGNLTSITVDSRNSSYTSIDGVLFNKEKTTLIKYPIGKKVSTYSIPSSVTAIGDYAFSGCNNLTSISIPSSVRVIGVGAFSCENLTSVTLSRRTQVGKNAFPASAQIIYRD
jgi:hypothetical protein